MFPTTSKIPDRTNKEYSDFVMELKKRVPNLRLVIQDDFEPVIDEERRKVVVHVKSEGDVVYGDGKNGKVEAEYFMAMTMDKEGMQIMEFVEFIDTQYTNEFIEKMGLKPEGVA